MKQVYKLLKISHKSVFVLLFILGLSQFGYAQAPTANAGPDATICENGTFTVSGSSATGSGLSYS